jgi:undecaprenyl diphosphate synthase
LFPDFDRRDLWRACEVYASRQRRFGGVIEPPAATSQGLSVPGGTVGASDGR